MADAGKRSRDKARMSDFTKSAICAWLDSLEANGLSVSTRSQRLAAMRSFLAYAAGEETIYMELHIRASTMPVKKKGPVSKDFLSVEEVEGILQAVPSGSPSGIRHYVLVATLYETAARVQEIRGLTIRDITYGSAPHVQVCGKGGRSRIIHLAAGTANMIRDCCDRLGVKDGHLFRNRRGEPLTDSGVDYILKKHARLASEEIPSLNAKRVSPHTIRRSKATHMLLSGVSLPVIQRFLGHKSIQTTEEYLEIGSDAMRAAIEASSNATGRSRAGDAGCWQNQDALQKLKEKLSLK